LAHGFGATKDIRAAIDWYLKAANHGFREAQFALGRIYWLGQGGAINNVEAYKWYALGLAAKTPGDGIAATAATESNYNASLMSADQLEKAKALVRDWRPAN
jgi:localization factor PodJL